MQRESIHEEYSYDSRHRFIVCRKPETDLPLMLKWLTDDRVLEYCEGRDVRFESIFEVSSSDGNRCGIIG